MRFSLPALFQIVPDLLLIPSIRSLQARYYLPVFLGMQISISHLIASYSGSRICAAHLNLC
ncbi:MAG: hypothetical protein GPJ07_24670 [Microcystis aeruginosa G13-07]|nr:hypothetical protein [Microcystis aeruginosa G13-07]